MRTAIEVLIEQVNDKFDELSHMLIEDYPTGYAKANTDENLQQYQSLQLSWFDGHVAALEWIMELIE